ncbi:zinc finger protein 502-like [Argopecten irradians]|uniref:zinc finger protein 502-like n=1 Tax=Argopecten irradians TaxID=31199 RepID=UPI0037241A63
MDCILKLCSELSNVGEEYVLLTAGPGGQHKQFGSIKGRQFLLTNQELVQRFFSYCYNATSTSMYMGGQAYSHTMDTVSMATNRSSSIALAHTQHSDSAASTIAGALQSLATEFHMGRSHVLMSGGEGHANYDIQERDVMSPYNVSYTGHHSNIHTNISATSDYGVRSNIDTFPGVSQEGLIQNLNHKSRQEFSENPKQIGNEDKNQDESDKHNSESNSKTAEAFEDNLKNPNINPTVSSSKCERSDDSNFSIGFEADLQEDQSELKLAISNVMSCLDQGAKMEQDHKEIDGKKNTLGETPKNKTSKLKQNEKEDCNDYKHKQMNIDGESDGNDSEATIVSDGNDSEATIVSDGNDSEATNVSDGNDSEATIVSDGNESEATIVLDTESDKTSCLRGAAKRKATFQCHRCGVCRKTFANSSNLRRHEKCHSVCGDQRRCKRCDEFVLISDMKQHFKLKHANDNKKQKLTCHHCGKICMSKSVLRTHFSKEHRQDSQHSTRQHSTTKRPKQTQGQHSALNHPNQSRAVEIKKCKTCGGVLGEEHECPGKRGHREFICPVCNKQFSRIQNLNLHRRIHSDNRIKLKCDLCHKLFSDRCSLKKHIRYVHSAERNFVCDVCGKSFKQNDTLKNHVKIHAEEKSDEFKCHLCSKLLSSKSALNVHQRSHTGVKPYMCEMCGMSFRQVANMRKHMLIHTTAKANQCELCGKEYKYRDSWKAHMRSHVIKEGLRHEVIRTKYGKVYNCEYCKKQFSTASQYKVHLRTHTDERPFKCDLCEKAFKEKGKLSRHINRVHVHSQVLSMHPHQKLSMDTRLIVPNDHVMYYTGGVTGV